MKYTIKSNDDCDYVLTRTETNDGVLLELFFGKDKAWTSPGKLIGSLLDTGNNIQLKFDPKVKLKQIDYNIAEYMRILLEFNNRDSHKPCAYSVCTEEFNF